MMYRISSLAEPALDHRAVWDRLRSFCCPLASWYRHLHAAAHRWYERQTRYDLCSIAVLTLLLIDLAHVI